MNAIPRALLADAFPAEVWHGIAAAGALADPWFWLALLLAGAVGAVWILRGRAGEGGGKKAGAAAAETGEFSGSVDELRAQVRLALESASAGWIQWDRKSDQFSWDPRAGAIFGLPPATAGGIAVWLACIDERERGPIEKTLRDAGMRNRRGTVEFHTTSGGSVRCTYELVLDESHGLERLDGVVTDLGASAPADVAAPPALRGMLGTSPEGFCLFEIRPAIPVWLPPEKIVQPLLERSVVIYCNETFAAVDGTKPAADLATRRIAEAFPNNAEAFKAIAHALVRTQFRLEGFQTEVFRKDASKKVLLENAL